MRMATSDPGLDRHEWESELATLEPDLESDPAGALPDLARLVERMARERGLLADGGTEPGGDPEIVAELRSGRDVARRLEVGDEVDPGDIANAIAGLRSVYEHVIAARGAP